MRHAQRAQRGKNKSWRVHKKRREQRSGTTQADIFAYSAAVLRYEAWGCWLVLPVYKVLIFSQNIWPLEYLQARCNNITRSARVPFLSPVQLDRTHVCPSQNISLCRLIDGESHLRCSRGWQTNAKVNYLNVFCYFLCECLCLHRVYSHFYRKLWIFSCTREFLCSHAGNISTFTLDNIVTLLPTGTCSLI